MVANECKNVVDRVLDKPFPLNTLWNERVFTVLRKTEEHRARERSLLSRAQCTQFGCIDESQGASTVEIVLVPVHQRGSARKAVPAVRTVVHLA